MTPAELRARILVAVGVPTTALVGTAGCKAPAAEAPVVAAAVDTDAGAAQAAASADQAVARGRTCAVDEVLESVCGVMKPAVLQRYPFARCAEAEVSFESFEREGGQRLIDPHRFVRDRRDVASFTFDPDETREALVASLHIPPESLANAKYGTSMCCFTSCTRLEVTRTVDPIPVGHEIAQTCVPAPKSGTSAPAEGSSRCPAAIRLRGRAVRFQSGNDERCCYATTRPSCPPGSFRTDDGECHHHNRGRPFREAGRPLSAPTRRSEGWAYRDAATGSEDLGPGVRASVAAAWSRNAAAEHASVAAFARLSLELLALGAPAELIAACHVAAIEEVEHARLSYGVASRFAGEPLGPGPLALESGARAISLVALAAETFEDGCIGETVAALEAEEARRLAADGAIARVLETIARDEAAHATLAFRILAWALGTGGASVRDRIEEMLACTEREARDDVASGIAGDEARLGILGEEAVASIRARAIRGIVLPCARAMLGDDRRETA